MSSMKLRSLLGPVLLGAGLMTAAATSSAAIYRGNWDPSFGAPYPDLGFRGFVDLLVPDECLDGDPISQWFADGSCGDMSLLAATVELYDANLGPSAPTIDTVVFAPPAVDPDPVLGVFIQFDANTGRNEVVGADTSIFGPQFGSGPGYSGNLWLEFVSGQMPIFTLLDTVTTLDAVPNGAFLHACLPDDSEASLCPEPEVRTTNPGTVTFQRVPEPGSIALVFGALAAGWAARRSIRKA